MLGGGGGGGGVGGGSGHAVASLKDFLNTDKRV